MLLAVSWISLYSNRMQTKTGPEKFPPGYVCKAGGQGFIITTGDSDRAEDPCPPSARYVMGIRFELAAAEKEDLKLLPGIGVKLADLIIEAKKESEIKECPPDFSGLNKTARKSLERWTYYKNNFSCNNGKDIKNK